MFETLLSMLRDIAGLGDPAEAVLDEKVALAALMVHTIAVDGSATEVERQSLHDALRNTFRLSTSQTARLVEEARRRDQEAVDLGDFTAILNRRMDVAGRERIVEMLWDLVYADGAAQEVEDAVVGRIADMLGVSAEVRRRLRSRAAATTRDG